MTGSGAGAPRTVGALSRELAVALEAQPNPADRVDAQREEERVIARPAVDTAQAASGNAAAKKAAAESRTRAAEHAVGIADPNYYGARELDVYPVLQTPLDLSAARGIASRVELLLLVDENGRVQNVSVIDTTGGADALRAIFLGALFSPALRDGRRVKSRLRIEVGSVEP